MSKSEPLSTADLLTLCRSALALKNSPDAEPFIDRVAVYLEAFDRWQQSFDIKTASGEGMRALIEELNAAHQELVACAKELSRDVLKQLGETHTRAKAVKTYLDRFPSRITIAGKREG